MSGEFSPAFRKDRQPSVRPDYILTYRLEWLWLLEVKRTRTLDQEAFAQAQFYAVPLSIRARYMVISDGLQIRVQDAWAESFDEPRIVTMSLEERFAPPSAGVPMLASAWKLGVRLRTARSPTTSRRL